MLKYLEYAITFAEFPDEIALAINITNCHNHCSYCSEPWLREDVGTELTESEIDSLISKHPGITLVGFMGGDSSHADIEKLAYYIHSKGLKVGMYSGLDSLDINLLNCLDYYKIGAWRMFTGDESTWKNQTAGPICLPTSNQILFKREGNKWINITDKFRTKKINDWKTTIILK